MRYPSHHKTDYCASSNVIVEQTLAVSLLVLLAFCSTVPKTYLIKIRIYACKVGRGSSVGIAIR